MSKEKLSKMTRGSNKSFYHFIVTDTSNDETKYFKTCKEITENYQLCKASIYNLLNGKHNSKKYNHLNIERYYQPITN